MNKTLSVIVISQFLCTSLWFAGNAILPELAVSMALSPSFLGHLTSAVQLGFITGTLLFAIFTIADKFSPSWVFFICALIASGFNYALSLDGLSPTAILVSRFGTGFFLAGIYPVGMKIASDYFQKGLGRSLGLLVGALVLGTAFPHFVRTFTSGLDWHYVVFVTSGLALVGGLMMVVLVPDGPYRSRSKDFDFTLFFSVFKNLTFRKAAYGYFGHMWELYAFWAFVPVFLAAYGVQHQDSFDLSLWSFVIIAVGGISCALGGILSQKLLPIQIARTALSFSGICCLLSPLFFIQPYSEIMLIFMVFWGVVVTADSPMFSTLVAQNVPTQNKGTALTIVNCIGFGITIFSIQLLNYMQKLVPPSLLLLVLILGPVFGSYHILRVKNKVNLR